MTWIRKLSGNGAVAHLGERLFRNQKVGSSILPSSTILEIQIND